jgi:ATP-binding cassette, subfamily B, multidrug efflux pump
MSILRKLTSGLEKKYRIFTCMSPLTMIGEVVMETLIPLIMAHIIDTGIANHDIQYVVRTGAIMVVASMLSLSCGVMGGRFAAVAALGFSRNLRRNLFAKVQHYSFKNMDKFGTASLVTRLTTDVTNMQNVYQQVIRGMVRAPFMLITGTVMACFINKDLAVLFFIIIPILAVMLGVIATKAYPRFREMFKKYDLLNTTVQENLTAIRVVKSYVRGEYEDKKFDDVADSLRNTQLRAEKIVILNMPIMQLVIYLCIIVVLWFGGNMIVAGKMQTGELISFITYITQILMSLMMLSMMFVMLILSRASLNRIVEVLDEDIDIKNPADKSEAEVHALTDSVETITTKNYFSKVLDGSIDFNHVYFSYDGRRDNCVLTDVDIHIKSGQTVGILGGTGSSKSTLVQLVPRLYDVIDGTVQVGGVDVRKYDLTVLRNDVGMVLQKNVLFSGTIKENLRWGNNNASDNELVAACKASDADEFVSAFPQGYDTMLEEGGVNLSGGQKQRLCIARALLKKPKILILDDSTSAVDTATDSRIRHALRSSLPDTTKLIIAQRIASVQDADVIFVLDDGKISGFGTHEELLASNTIYREVYDSQMSKNGGNE